MLDFFKCKPVSRDPKGDLVQVVERVPVKQDPPCWQRRSAAAQALRSSAAAAIQQ